VAEKNRKFAHMFGNLVDKSLKRENVVGHITSGLGYELSQLADFLDKVERRRPKGDQTCKWFVSGVVIWVFEYLRYHIYISVFICSANCFRYSCEQRQ
jgi:hypothetical protein